MSIGGSCPGITKQVWPCLDHLVKGFLEGQKPDLQSLISTAWGRHEIVPISEMHNDIDLLEMFTLVFDVWEVHGRTPLAESKIANVSTTALAAIDCVMVAYIS